jgi:hypothetical protein
MKTLVAFLVMCVPLAARADSDPACGAAELTKANQDLSTGAHMLASRDQVTSLLGLQLMQVAADLRRVTEWRCWPLEADRAKLWGDAAFDDSADPWQGEAKPAPALFMTSSELAEAAVVLGVVATPQAVASAMSARGMLTP